MKVLKFIHVVYLFIHAITFHETNALSERDYKDTSFPNALATRSLVEGAI